MIVEVPSFEKLRIHGVSNLNAFSDGLRVLKTLNTERRRARKLRTAGRSGAELSSVLADYPPTTERVTA
jgi:hypothetical protein